MSSKKSRKGETDVEMNQLNDNDNNNNNQKPKEKKVSEKLTSTVDAAIVANDDELKKDHLTSAYRQFQHRLEKKYKLCERVETTPYEEIERLLGMVKGIVLKKTVNFSRTNFFVRQHDRIRNGRAKVVVPRIGGAVIGTRRFAVLLLLHVVCKVQSSKESFRIGKHKHTNTAFC